MLNWIRRLVAGKDNETPDVIRVSGMLVVLHYISIVTYAVVFGGQVFDAIVYATGVGAIFASIGGAVRLKQTDEPEPKK